MANDKKTMLRYQIIDECLRGGKTFYSIKMLIAAMAAQDIIVKKRAILYDLANMKECDRLNFKAPIERCPKEKGYYYSDPEFTIAKLPLTDAQFQTLADVLSLIKSKEAFKEIESLIDKMLLKGKKESKKFDTTDVIEFEKAPFIVGSQHVHPLIEHIRKKQPLTLTYQKFSSEFPSDYTIHPYFLKEYDSRWYLLCYYLEKNEMRTFALDRIQYISIKKTRYVPCKLTNPRDYFRDIVGITLAKGPVQKIILQCKPSLSFYLKSKPLHQSQKILTDTHEGFTIELELIPNYELTSIILGYGSKVKVLSPRSLIEEIDKEKA